MNLCGTIVGSKLALQRILPRGAGLLVQRGTRFRPGCRCRAAPSTRPPGTRRFEVWVPRSQAATAKLAATLPRTARGAVMRAIGVTKIARETDLAARREDHERAFGRR